MNELEEDLRIETVKRRMRQKPVSFKIKNKKIARKKIIESGIEIKTEIITKTVEIKLEILRKIIEKTSRELKIERK